jgi:hypothetical protein
MLDNRLGTFYFIFFYLKKILNFFFNYQNLNNQNKKLNLKIFKNQLNKKISKKNSKSILLVCLENFEIYFFYIWLIIFYSLKEEKYCLKVVTSYKNNLINRILKELKISNIKIEDLKKKKIKIRKELINKINNLNEFKNFYNFKYDSFDVGMMIISNFCRVHKVGFINYNSKIQKFILKKTILNFIKEYEIIKNEEFFRDTNIVFTFEKNLFHYLHFFLFSLKKKTDLIHWSGSNLDERTFIIKKYTKKNIYSHHSSISSKLWSKISNISNFKIISKNKKIFKMRFSGNYAPFSVNLLECKKSINFKIEKKNNKKNCIIFSHILHDTLYFFGKEFYDSYTHWLISTIKIACKNTKVNWFIKIHPSNLYRGEFKKGFSKEEDIIRQEIKYIPPHIKFIYPDTKINPLTWMNFADIGITVRGTSGLEMAVLKKTVITCGKNRYENKGFTIDPKNKQEYEKILLNLPKVKKMNSKFNMRANLFYNYVFEKKGFKCDFLDINNKHKVFNWNNLDFKIKKNFHKNNNLNKFKKFLLSKKEIEYIN